MRHLTSAAIGIGALLVAAAAPVSATGWDPGVPYDGGPACDINDNGVADGYFNEFINHDYHLAGKVNGDTLTGKYRQRFDQVLYQPNNPEGDEGPGTGLWDPEAPDILVTGQVEVRGTITLDDFADLRTITDIDGVAEMKWSYTITDTDGVFLTVSSGSLTMNPATGEITYGPTYGPCTEP